MQLTKKDIEIITGLDLFNNVEYAEFRIQNLYDSIRPYVSLSDNEIIKEIVYSILAEGLKEFYNIYLYHLKLLEI